jgi:hypothetical protein
MALGDFIGPLVFLGIAAYGVWAFINKQFPFNIDLSGALGDGSLGGTTDGLGGLTGVDCNNNPCTCDGTATGAAGYLSYATRKKKSSKHSSKKKTSSKHSNKSKSTGGGGTTTGGGACPCDCSGGGGGTVGTTGGGVWGQNPKSKTPCDIPNQPCPTIGALGGTSNWCKCVAGTAGAGYLSEYAQYGDYGLIGAEISRPLQFRSNVATYGDYGLIGSQISRPLEFRSNVATSSDYGGSGALVSGPLQFANYAKSSDYGAIGNAISMSADALRSYQGNYDDELYDKSDSYYPVQYGYLGSWTNSRLNQLTGWFPTTPNPKPLAEYQDRAVPVAVS